MTLPRKIKLLLEEFAKEMERWNKNKEIPSDFFITTNYNKNSEQHSKILGILAFVAYRQGYLVQVGRGLFRLSKKRYRFTPDLVLKKKDENIIIEYESTNSSDYRVVNGDLRYYDEHIKYLKKEKEKLPKFWIEIITLPNQYVERKRWYSWDVRRKRVKKFEEIIKNPFKFYIPHFIRKIRKVNIVSCPFVLVNININKLEVLYPKKFKFEIEIKLKE